MTTRLSKMQHFYAGLFIGLGGSAIAALMVADLFGDLATGWKVALPLVGAASLAAMNYKYRVSGFGGTSESR